jgi:hypothetical protein
MNDGVSPMEQQPNVWCAIEVRNGVRVHLDKLDELQSSLQRKIFGDPPLYVKKRADVAGDDQRVIVLLDLLEAMALIDPGDVSHPWTRGSVLYAVGRHLEAAHDFLEAAARSRRLAESGEGFGDEEDWTKSCIFHAAENFVLSGHLLSAELLIDHVSMHNRGELEQLIDSGIRASQVN